MELLPIPPNSWPAALCALQQHPRYGRAVGRLGGRAELLRLCEAGQDIAHLQLLRRRLGPVPVAWLGRGPVWRPEIGDDARAAALVALPRLLPGLAALMPETAADARLLSRAGLPALFTPQSVAELDLTHPAPARLNAQHGKWRNRLRKAEAAGLHVAHRPLDPDRDAPLLDLELAQRRARRYAALPPAFTRAWAAEGPGTTRLFTATCKGEVAAFLLLLLHPPVATYHIGWTGAQGRRASAHHLLLWQAAEWLARMGYARLDLGSVDTDAAPGLARFKLGSGATLRQLGPTLLRLPALFPIARAFPLAIPGRRG